jgi:hypothetical protein
MNNTKIIFNSEEILKSHSEIQIKFLFFESKYFRLLFNFTFSTLRLIISLNKRYKNFFYFRYYYEISFFAFIFVLMIVLKFKTIFL